MSETPRVPERGNTRSSKVSFAATCHEPEADSDVRPESPARSNIDGYDIETATGVDGRIVTADIEAEHDEISCEESPIQPSTRQGRRKRVVQNTKVITVGADQVNSAGEGECNTQ
eukprot:m.260460 g.260460  ORF g.260460 m.260460 type:complete len:115 (+) comp19681_c0_seq3:2555-2899(+)